MTVHGVLLDLEGVLYEGDEAIAGARTALERLRAARLGLCFLTNTTTRPRREIAARLRDMGFALDETELFTPPLAAARLLSRDRVRRVHLAAPAGLAEDFAAFDLVDETPEAVVLGDLHTGFTWERLNGLFAMLRGGARLIALHRNRYCRRDGAIALDLGPFVAALEYAARVEAEVVGKPAAAFFALALAHLGVAAGAAVMVGDDIEADIGGARAAGIRAVQVETGKFTPADRERADIRVDGRIASIADLPDWIEAEG